ncbi:4'-phosphopantetheinyl transferase superfamily protein [Streptomyces sp. NBC_01571]|uniref:4'-phosphopantetheinyl transferase family protein n=1 Tax=Streptomyces sp. NBC_01571 TaxID=2975883 RepID=UPI002257EFD5|nr:4'-phosphopantetheinyl transferase superfamily protein [Streptomyces sp. NBC_01571]MCX4578824.1 4'-phosphopantetheinyl transferase superfamily protein [Streptomyces sp. NBC_01571]
MIEELLPDSVVSVEALGDDAAGGARLYPEEEALAVSFVHKRRSEFAAVRGCARQAMEKLGVAPRAVPRGDSGAPIWPAGLIGSMTHCEGYCAASLARAGDLASLGIDAEPHQELPEDVIVSVALPTENDRLRRLAERDPSVHWDRLLFSAKESVYKAWFPLMGQWLDFLEADIDLFEDGGPAPHGAGAGASAARGSTTGTAASGAEVSRGPVSRGPLSRGSVTGHPVTGHAVSRDSVSRDSLKGSATGGPERSGGFRATLLVPGPLVGGRRIQSFDGRWTVRQGLLATAVAVPHGGTGAV